MYVTLDYALITVMTTITKLLNDYSVAGTIQITNKHDHIYSSQQALKVVALLFPYYFRFTDEDTKVPKD